MEEYNTVVEALEYLTEYYTRSRYPFILRGKVLGPEDIIDSDIARKGVELAGRALEVVRSYLRGRGVIQG